MLIAQPQGKIFKKIFRKESGEFILATFVVVESNGRLKARLIATEIISADIFTSPVAEALPVLKPKSVSELSYTPNFYETINPYFDFSFFVSQPTRAPAC